MAVKKLNFDPAVIIGMPKNFYESVHSRFKDQTAIGLDIMQYAGDLIKSNEQYRAYAASLMFDAWTKDYKRVTKYARRHLVIKALYNVFYFIRRVVIGVFKTVKGVFKGLVKR